MPKISNYIKHTPYIDDNFLKVKGQIIYDGIIQLASEGKTYTEICKALHISSQLLKAIFKEDEAFYSLIEGIMLSESTMVLEQIKSIPWDEPDYQVAKIKIDALSRYLELRWPSLYGKRLDVTIKTLDLTQALRDAKARIKDNTQLIDLDKDSYKVITDNVSVNIDELLI